jgi:hypothetical protein
MLWLTFVTGPRASGGPSTANERRWHESGNIVNELLVLPGLGRDWRHDAALRPQPKRELDDATMPPGRPRARCSAHLAKRRSLGTRARRRRAIARLAECGCRAIPTQDDFLHQLVPDNARILITNPPFHLHSAFIERSMLLLDEYRLDAVVLLFRHDHLQSECRTPPHCRLSALQQAEDIYICPWRPIWIEGSSGNGRWTFSWVVWQANRVGPPVMHWLKQRSR